MQCACIIYCSVEFADANTAQQVKWLDTEPMQLSVHPQSLYVG